VEHFVPGEMIKTAAPMHPDIRAFMVTVKPDPNLVYVLDQAGTMHIFEAAPEFKLVGSPSIGESSFATPAYMDDRLYLRTDDHLYCIGK